jgi:hypothetical protein
MDSPLATITDAVLSLIKQFGWKETAMIHDKVLSKRSLQNSNFWHYFV